VAAVGVLAVVIVSVAVLWAVQRSIVYIRDTSTPNLQAMGEGWEGVTLETSDGLALAAWYRAPESGRPLVIVFNGNAGNRGDRTQVGRSLAAAGLGVLLIDYRGYGGNPGSPTEEGLARDARAAADFAAERVSPDSLVYFGESLGAAVAIELATERPPAALILRSPFTSLVAVGRAQFPWLPVSLLLKDRYPSDERMGLLRAPTLVIAGDADATVPFEQSRAIYEAAPEPKRLVVIEGADHNDAALVAGAGMIDEIARFLEPLGPGDQ
jgi:fermentation-respiration switch protein FrsA (DUF1100 family)